MGIIINQFCLNIRVRYSTQISLRKKRRGKEEEDISLSKWKSRRLYLAIGHGCFRGLNNVVRTLSLYLSSLSFKNNFFLASFSVGLLYEKQKWALAALDSHSSSLASLEVREIFNQL